jgi:hypothetical protein
MLGTPYRREPGSLDLDPDPEVEQVQHVAVRADPGRV